MTDPSESTTNDATDDTARQPRRLSEAELNLENGEIPCYKFVLTGGPCGGKTTALARLFGFLRERGFEVISCPEAFTLLSTNGFSPEFFGTDGIGKIVQSSVMDIQMNLEDSVERILKARGKPAVVLCDRGVMDGSVYVTMEEFQHVLEGRGTDIVQVRDNRYDAVFHLVTAADGAEKFYSLDNNQARTETAEEARAVDRKTNQAWLGHPHLYAFDNSTDFEQKLERLVDVVSKIVGLPSNLQRRSAKFLLRSEPSVSQFPEDIELQWFEVEKIYLQSQPPENLDNYSFIRRRTNIDVDGKTVGSGVHQLTTVRKEGNEVIEVKRIISKREYVADFNRRDRSRHVVRQRRISFIYEYQSFVVHIYEAPVSDLCILHAQVESDPEGEPKVDLPPFLDVERRLTNTKEDECRFGAYSLSLISNREDCNTLEAAELQS